MKTVIGPYELRGKIGSGAMGEVYRAWDTRLHREVAVKLLPPEFAADPERLRRFELEARAAAGLRHENILVVYDIGNSEDTPYLVSELLKGGSLRELLNAGPLRMERALDLAIQIASGLEAAHRNNIVHRDIKPENLFITDDGRAKILDFGLAKAQPAKGNATAAAQDSQAGTQSLLTGEGALLGTAAYMAPEQVRSEAVDARSDLFSFGCVLYEMLTGRRAFRGDGLAETISSVLRDEPVLEGLAPALAGIVRHCLEKNPERRFQTAQDLSFSLRAAIGGKSEPIAGQHSGRKVWAFAALGIIAAAIVSGVLMRRDAPQAASPAFHRLTFRRGRVHSARFTPDGNGAVYSAQWEEEPSEVFDIRFDSPGSRALGFPQMQLAAVSKRGELALIDRAVARGNPFSPRGTLGRAPMAGGALRPLEDRVSFADFAATGEDVAIVRETDVGSQLEFPSGTPVYTTAGFVSNVRVSPTGDAVAFIDHPSPFDNRGSVALVPRGGPKRALTGEYAAAEGLSWTPDGREIWFTAARTGSRMELRGVNLDRKERVVWGQSGRLILHDISRSGKVLLADCRVRTKLIFHSGPGAPERDLSWLDWSLATSLSPDGKYIAFFESGEGAGADPVAYIRGTDGSNAVQLGPGRFPQFSPDGRFVVAAHVNPSEVMIYPVGAGQVRRLEMPGFEILEAGLLPDGTTVWFNGNEPGHGRRLYLLPVGGKPAPISPEGVTVATSPTWSNGEYLVGTSSGQNMLYPIHGGEPRPIAGSGASEQYAGAAGSAMFMLSRYALPAVLSRLDPQTARRTQIAAVAPLDQAGVRTGITRFVVSPDGSAWAYSLIQELSELFVVDGLK